MFGTIARMRVKQGMGSAVDDLSKKFESRRVDGWLSTNIYRSRNDAQEFWISVVFRDETSYRKTRTIRSRTSGSGT